MRTLAQPETRAEVVERLRQLQPTDPAQWGVMNAGEMLCHVRGAFRMAIGELPTEAVRVGIPKSALKAVALRGPLPWVKDFTTVGGLRRGAPAMQVGPFEQDRETALAALERFCRGEQARIDHPMMGAMSEWEWMRWGFLHTDHHLRQFGR